MLNEVMAVFELCKNGYDADARKVEVHFEELATGNGRIRIIDNGEGMTSDDIENKFMMVATSSRLRKTKSTKGRSVVGEKGIGRFAMDRLSHKTTILSYPENEKTGYKIVIDWDRYEVEGVSFTAVGNDYDPFEKSPEKSGVEIIAENLRDEWNEEKIKKLDGQLQKLVPPEEFNIKHPFSIELHAKEFGIEGKFVESAYLKKAPYHLVGTLHSNGEMSLSISYKGKRIIGSGISNKFCEDGRVGDNPVRCGPVKYKLWGFPFDTPGESKWSKFYGTRFESNIRQWIEEVQGVRIYRDGFRVMPYGEKDNDWTDRATRQRNMSGALPKKHMLGYVTITQDENPSLMPSATRFHLLEGEAFEDLKQFVSDCDKVLDNIMHDERVKEREKEKRDVPKLLEKKANEIRKIKELPIQVKTALARDLEDYATYLIEEKEASKKHEEKLMSKLEAYRDLASLGITTGMVSHEISRDIANLIGVSELLERGIKSNNLTKKNLEELQTNFSSSIRFIRDYMSLVRNFTVTLKGDQKEFRKKIKFNVKTEIDFYKERMESLLERNKIDLINLIPEHLEVYMYRADFQSIVFNLISNSFKSIIRRRNTLKPHEKSVTRNKIKINIDSTVSPSYLGIAFSDDGTGVRPSIQDRIFDLFFTDYQRENEPMKGSGLGLTLIKEIAEGYGGDVELLPTNEFSPGATFLVTLKKDEISESRMN